MFLSQSKILQLLYSYSIHSCVVLCAVAACERAESVLRDDSETVREHEAYGERGDRRGEAAGGEGRARRERRREQVLNTRLQEGVMARRRRLALTVSTARNLLDQTLTWISHRSRLPLHHWDQFSNI